MLKVILISGKARSGKDTLAMYLKDEAILHGKKTLIIKYADILKFVCQKYFGWNGEKDEKGRTILQQVGTNLCRDNSPDIWVNCVIEIVKGLQTEFDYVLIPDTRFPNEIKQWWGSGFDSVTVRVNRVNDDLTEYDNGLNVEQKQHPSEIMLDNYVFDWRITNNKITDLQEAAQEIFKSVEEY